MKKLLLAAVACAAVATPALARDRAGYLGIEGGILFPRPTNFKADGENLFSLRYKRGVDLDAVAGYDFGMFRLEGELGYKRTKIKYIDFGGGDTLTPADFDTSNRASVLSGMVNGLVDFGLAPGASLYAGGGVGRARVKALDGHDSAWAWQLIAGARTAVSPNVDLGLKYRYFQTGKLGSDFEDETNGVNVKFRSHSLLASLIFNFGSPVVAPPPAPAPVVEVAPPPPPPPATQTCPDGSVIDATAACPVPPPPPAPPAKGERG